MAGSMFEGRVSSWNGWVLNAAYRVSKIPYRFAIDQCVGGAKGSRHVGVTG